MLQPREARKCMSLDKGFLLSFLTAVEFIRLLIFLYVYSIIYRCIHTCKCTYWIYVYNRTSIEVLAIPQPTTVSDETEYSLKTTILVQCAVHAFPTLSI